MRKCHSIHIVDDDDIFQFTIEKYLEKFDFEGNIIASRTGEEAVQYLISVLEGPASGSIPDIILLDINMPVMSGWEFMEEYEKIKDRLPHTPVIYIISSSVNESDMKKAKENEHIREYITKPLDPDKLKEIIGAA